MNALPDIVAENHGSIWLARAHTPAGTAWLDEHVAFELFFGGAGVLEWRYVADVINGAREDGLDVRIG